MSYCLNAAPSLTRLTTGVGNGAAVGGTVAAVGIGATATAGAEEPMQAITKVAITTVTEPNLVCDANIPLTHYLRPL